MDKAGVTSEWGNILRDLDALTETAITCNGKTFVVRSDTVGVAGKIAKTSASDCPTPFAQLDSEKEADSAPS